jgi:hypothetical protein
LSLEILTPSRSRGTSLQRSGEAGDGLSLKEERAASRLFSELESVMERIEPLSLRNAMGAVFTFLTSIIGHLQEIEGFLREDDPRRDEKIIAEFHQVKEETWMVVAFIETGMQTSVFGSRDESALTELLDSTCYAIKKELGRVLDEELVELKAAQPSALIRPKVAYANGLLGNCVEQSIIALATGFDARFESKNLFTDQDARLEQSLTLARDLMALIRLGRRVDKDRDRESITSLLEGLRLFRHQSMQFLMYKDWEESERLFNEVLRTDRIDNLGDLMDGFCCYLEVLLGQVKMRGALRDLDLEL